MSDASVIVKDPAIEEQPKPVADLLGEDSQFAKAVQRAFLSKGCPVDPQAAVAPFNSAF
jgi:hypothetical protein